MGVTDENIGIVSSIGFKGRDQMLTKVFGGEFNTRYPRERSPVFATIEPYRISWAEGFRVNESLHLFKRIGTELLVVFI